MMQSPLSRALRRASLLALGLLAGAAFQAPAYAAGNLGQFTKGVLAPADITGAVVFGKNGEVIPLDAKGKPATACVMSKAAPAGSAAKKSALPECDGSDAKPGAEAAKPKSVATTCDGYYIIWVGGVAIKVWYPAGCTPP